ncbi:MAG TPA: transketolase [Candidatus Levybacteria bacterium]|nr:transketolase [Candidatus Levybacteria bacterium]
MITNITQQEIYSLQVISTEIQILIIKMLEEAGSGHPGGSLGMSDIFTCMYFHILNKDPKKPLWEDRDRLVLSNGHICPVLYATLAKAGYFPLDWLNTLRKINSPLQGHPHRGVTPGVENTSGPLGEGLSQAIGMALAAKMDKKDWHVYCLTSDGEHQEGNTWEAVMLAPKYELDNLTVVIDRNMIQIDGLTEKIVPLEVLRLKYESFNWNVYEVDGHDMAGFVQAVQSARKTHGRPTCIIAHTIPGKNVSFMENDYLWHGKAPNKDEAAKALGELNALLEKLKGNSKLI